VQFIDLLLFATVAAFLLYRLSRVLGRRSGHERPAEPSEVPERVVPLPKRQREPRDNGEAQPELALGGNSGMTQIKIADPTFDEQSFVQGARGAFEIVINAFAAGDRRRLRALLGDSVYRNFTAAIDRREKAGERLEATLVSIVLADILGARMAGRQAMVTVKFLSEQINVTRNAAGEVTDGDPNHVVTVTDVWTFARDTRSRDPNWQLVETRDSD